MKKIPTKIPNTDTDFKYRYRPSSNPFQVTFCGSESKSKPKFNIRLMTRESFYLVNVGIFGCRRQCAVGVAWGDRRKRPCHLATRDRNTLLEHGRPSVGFQFQSPVPRGSIHELRVRFDATALQLNRSKRRSALLIFTQY